LSAAASEKQLIAQRLLCPILAGCSSAHRRIAPIRHSTGVDLELPQRGRGCGRSRTSPAVVTLVFAGIAAFASWADGLDSSSTTPTARSRLASPIAVRALPTLRDLRVRGYELQVRSVPEQFGRPALASVELLSSAQPLNGARVRVTFSMPSMPDMRGLSILLRQIRPGVYAHASPILTVGHWRATFRVDPRHGAGFDAAFVYRIRA
jgi:hypothetical protein